MAAASTMMMLNGKFFFNSPRKILAASQNSLTKEKKRILVPKGIPMKEVSIVGAILTALESPNKSSLALQNVVEGQGEGDYRSFALLIPIIPGRGLGVVNHSATSAEPIESDAEQIRQMRNQCCEFYK